MAEERGRLGSSGVFRAIVDGARKFKRALSEDGTELSPEARAIGNKIGQAFIAGRFGDVYMMGTPTLQSRTTAEQFERSWRNTLSGPLSGFELTSAGPIDLGFIPGLEEVTQDKFVAFVEITFATPDVPLDDENAFTVGAVLLTEGDEIRVGALHAQ